MPHTIFDVVNRLKRNRDTGKGCVLLIGAGCSSTAGIPLAHKFVDIIRDEFAHEYRRAIDKDRADYPGCMGELSPGDRRELMGRYLRNARINWAHIHMARLIKEGYVDRVLTTNFDPLLVRACALFNIFPAVYDMAAIKGFEPQRIEGPAIFHLHGTGNGFFQAHDHTEVEELSGKLIPLFQDCLARPRTWIVAGYSAKCDPVVDHLLAVPSFDQNLYWVGYRDEVPSSDVQPLIAKQRAAYWLPGHHADGFFADLADGVACAPPPFLDKPFTHMETVLRDITGFREEDGNSSHGSTLPSFASDGLRRIRRAIACVEPHVEWTCNDAGTPLQPKQLSQQNDGPSLGLQMKMRLMASDFNAVIEQREAIIDSNDEATINTLLWALTSLGSKSSNLSELVPDDEKQINIDIAINYFREAISINPDFMPAHHNLGNAFVRSAEFSPTPDKAAIYEQAFEHYRRAIELAPKNAVPYDSMAGAILKLLKAAPDTKKDELLAQASDFSQRANDLEPNSGAYNLACIAALTGKEDACQHWLTASKGAGEIPDKAHVKDDPDLAAMRDQPWFQKFVNELER